MSPTLGQHTHSAQVSCWSFGFGSNFCNVILLGWLSCLTCLHWCGNASLQAPQYLEVRRCFFTAENHVPLCGLNVCGLPREIISHMDGCRFVHMMSRKTGTVSQYLASADVKTVKQTCFLGSKLEWDLLGVCLLGVRCLLSQLWNFVQIAVAEFGNWFNAY